MTQAGRKGVKAPAEQARSRSTKSVTPAGPRKPTRAQIVAARRRKSRLLAYAKGALVVVVVIAALAGIFISNRPSGQPGAGAYRFDVGTPGPGEAAPDFLLRAAGGGTWGSEDRSGSTLLFFQEGVMCQPCWDQLRDIETESEAFRAAGIDDVVTITADPLDVLEQKVAAEGFTTKVLSDPTLEVSRQYGTNGYGMHGESNNGHSFILVGADGTVQWRADYGGPPDFTMYVPTENLLADIRAGLDGGV